MMNSRAKACPSLTEGTVTPPDLKGWKTPLRAKEAHMDAETCAAMYAGTWTHGKCRSAAKAIVSAGFRWAPEMWPVDRITIITASPEHAAFPISVSAPLYFWLTMGPAVAPNINIKVPTNSAPSYHVATGSIRWIFYVQTLGCILHDFKTFFFLILKKKKAAFFPLNMSFIWSQQNVIDNCSIRENFKIFGL